MKIYTRGLNTAEALGNLKELDFTPFKLTLKMSVRDNHGPTIPLGVI